MRLPLPKPSELNDEQKAACIPDGYDVPVSVSGRGEGLA